jgi:hypothetical protein
MIGHVLDHRLQVDLRRLYEVLPCSTCLIDGYHVRILEGPMQSKELRHLLTRHGIGNPRYWNPVAGTQ